MKELEEDLSLIVDPAAVKSYADTLRKVQALAGSIPPSLWDISSPWKGLSKPRKTVIWISTGKSCCPLFQDVLKQLVDDRRREGGFDGKRYPLTA